MHGARYSAKRRAVLSQVRPISAQDWDSNCPSRQHPSLERLPRTTQTCLTQDLSTHLYTNVHFESLDEITDPLLGSIFEREEIDQVF